MGLVAVVLVWRTITMVPRVKPTAIKLNRDELLELFGEVEPESRAGEPVGVPQAVAAEAAGAERPGGGR